MNLLQTPWLIALDDAARRTAIAPGVIGNPRFIDLYAPRADFRGALYQFLIGLLQTAYAPADADEWTARWISPPDEKTLQTAFAPYRQAFEFDADGAAFMQDLDMLDDAPTQPARNLLIDAGSDSNSHFNKQGPEKGFCPRCAAQALFTLQINAPSGGRGHRVSLRGGGPLTTLVLPRNENTPLWQKLWLNVLPQDSLGYRTAEHTSEILPWLAPTRVSDQPGNDTTPEIVHPLQAYWSMSRRIRLDLEQTIQGSCILCGQTGEHLITRYRARHSGTNYTGAWLHPLTPYLIDTPREGKTVKPPISLKGSRGEKNYRHWLDLTIGEEENTRIAQVAAIFNTDKKRCAIAGGEARLWCFGFDMSNMKALCWYDHVLPLPAIEEKHALEFRQSIVDLLDVAGEAARLLDRHVKQARFSRPADAAGAPAVPQSFWQQSEAAFYRMLHQLQNQTDFQPATLAPLYGQWLREIRRNTLDLFDDWVLAAPIEAMNMKRVGGARAELEKWIDASKPMVRLWKIAEASGPQHQGNEGAQ